MNENQEREAFEAWCSTQVGSTDSTKNQRSIIDAWRGWEARAALAAKAVPAGHHTVDCIGLALDLEARSKVVDSQTTERAMLDAAHGLRLLAAAPTPEESSVDADAPERRCGGPGCDGNCCQPASEATPEDARMTSQRAAFFMERFLREEKLLGPNEQAALRFVIAQLGATPAQAQQADEETFSADQWRHAELDGITKTADQRRALAVARKFMRQFAATKESGNG